ncbi:SDR family NAD(P)-dependent oxidoreductase [Novosphingobium malaysiense]|uniref:Short-chain dehydrogenase n=1 Tax=Novosphingobium malaysiense TaxID=1348853 RepID=A0A0B1ZLW1_9SPHN|nr:SDR family NAD(P)-dependent oxidoreductase [Novosphingobium malaysiense]KHK90329.1 short-chain dehydrogenase [Novosphingobium malaysiense]
MARSVIVTGGFGVLGQAVAQSFVQSGDKVARIDYAAAPAVMMRNALDIGGIDLTDIVATQLAVDTVIAAHGGLDILINIAGGFIWETLEDGDLASWARMHAMNLMTGVTITKLSLKALKTSGAGRIINLGAGGAVNAGMGMAPYAASKSGVHRLTEALAEELAGTSVTVNAVLPSIIDTPANRMDMPDADFSQWVQPDGIAKVIQFIASQDGGAITGALIPVSRRTN